MSFFFSGIFANAGPDLLADFRDRFGGVGRLIETPFKGFGVRLILDAVNQDPEDATENEYATALIKFSERHPTTTFVYLYAECHAGPCIYAGFAFRAGARVHDEPVRDAVEDYSALGRLVAYLGVESGGYFEPFERDYFGELPPALDGSVCLAARRQANPPMQRTGAAGIVSFIRKLLGRGSGR